MIEFKKLKCEYCNKEYSLDRVLEGNFHENNTCCLNPLNKMNWFKVTKISRSSNDIYFVASKRTDLTEDCLEWIGENAPDGSGYCYGYEVCYEECDFSDVNMSKLMVLPLRYRMLDNFWDSISNTDFFNL